MQTHTLALAGLAGHWAFAQSQSLDAIAWRRPLSRLEELFALAGPT
jgi:hypothetical protein